MTGGLNAIGLHKGQSQMLPTPFLLLYVTTKQRTEEFLICRWGMLQMFPLLPLFKD